MIFAIAAQAIIAPTFEPPLVFSGEDFRVAVPGNAVPNRLSNMRLRGGIGRVQNPGPASFWLIQEENGRVSDAAYVSVPTALVPKWQRWPAQSGSFGGAAFLIGEKAKIALVPVLNNIGAVAVGPLGERRYPKLFSLDVSARSAPQHERSFLPDYIYSGATHTTLIDSPGGIARVSVRVDEEGVEAVIAARFAISGQALLLGKSHPINIRAGETVRLTETF